MRSKRYLNRVDWNMDRIQQRFSELEEMGKQVAESLGIKVFNKPNKIWMMGQPRGTSPHEVETIDSSLFKQWRVSVLTLLEQVFGPSKTAYREFEDYPSYCLSSAQFFHELIPIFRAAKADYEGGYLFDVRNLVHAEVFSNELEQAEHFLNSDYKVAAAVTTGVVLETTIKKICDQNAIPVTVQNWIFSA